MSGDLLHTQDRLREIPQIIKKEKIDTILLLGMGAHELYVPLQNAFPGMKIQFFDDKDTKTEPDNRVYSGARSAYENKRVLVIDEAFYQ